VTTLYVTHDQTEAMTLGDRIALLRDGRVLQVGTPRDLYERPLTPFAASFIGPYPMNLLKAGLEEEAGSRFARVGTARVPLPSGTAIGERVAGRRNVLLGVRPEHARAHPGESAGPGIRGTVIASENMGRETVITADIGGASLRAVAAEGTFREGDGIRIEIPSEAVRLFPEEDGPDRPGAFPGKI
jgi:ABC-type sugar transport system ATPase subunit